MVRSVKNVQSVLPATRYLIYNYEKKSTHNFLRRFLFFYGMPKSEESETIYERVAKLEDEAAALRAELDEMKHALRNELARHEIKMVRKGNEISSIID